MDERKTWKQEAKRLILPHFASYDDLQKDPKIFEKGSGCYVVDMEGNRYLDTFASLLTTIVGHGHPKVLSAMTKQLEELAFFPNFYDTFTVPQVRLAKKLEEIAPDDLSVSFFVNSGSEACETAMKMAKQYHYEKGDKGRYKVIARRHSYHGTTLGGISATGLSWFKEPFEPLAPNFRHVMSANCHACEADLVPESCDLFCLRSLERTVRWEGPSSISAIIIDPIPGSNVGFPQPPTGYLEALRALCDRYGILLIYDEVQTGFGKTGKMFACEHTGVTPDFLALGKGITGGYAPLGVVMTTKSIADVFSQKSGTEFRSGSTYGGHNLSCAAALAVIDVIQQERLVERAAALGAHIKKRLESFYVYECVGDIRGIGLLWAVELMADRKRKTPLDPTYKAGTRVRDFCYERGLILRNNGDILVMAPALTMSDEQIEHMLDMIEKAIQQIRF